MRDFIGFYDVNYVRLCYLRQSPCADQLANVVGLQVISAAIDMIPSRPSISHGLLVVSGGKPAAISMHMEQGRRISFPNDRRFEMPGIISNWIQVKKEIWC